MSECIRCRSSLADNQREGDLKRNVSVCIGCRRGEDAARSERKAITLKAWKAANPDKIREAKRRDHAKNGKARRDLKIDERRRYDRECKAQWRRENPDLARERRRVWAEANPDKVKATNQRTRANHKGKILARNAERKARLRQARPQWYDRDKVAVIYAATYWLNRAAEWLGSDVSFHVDHVVPIKGRSVCGLHVHDNLMIDLAKANMSKGNRFSPDALDIDWTKPII